jgi:hypothetical protein
MLCISILQPWATLWLLQEPDEKWFETRSWSRTYRGELLVHAGKRKDREVTDGVRKFARELSRHGIHSIEDLTFGALIGKVDLIGCHKMSTLPEPDARERKAGVWHPERFAWKREAKPCLFTVPIPYRGALSLFEVPDELIAGSGCKEKRHDPED